MEVLLIGDELSAFIELDLHELVDLVFSLQIFGELALQEVYFVLLGFLLLHLLLQVGVVLLEVRLFLLLKVGHLLLSQHRQFWLFVERPLFCLLVGVLIGEFFFEVFLLFKVLALQFSL